MELIEKVRPAVLVKGADYRLEEVVGRKQVESWGGDVVLVGIVPGHSTTGLVERSAKAAQVPLAPKRSTKPARS
jgi:D-beta-D-heptose 7-phosphate kinase/D-beta-D-heptose 1-phosphate adenosyltransferase